MPGQCGSLLTAFFEPGHVNFSPQHKKNIAFWLYRVYIINMSTFKKTAMVLVLLMSLAVFAYGETSYSLSFGYYRLGEEFLGDDFGRGQNGSNANFTFYYFPEKIVLGFLFRTSFGTLGSGYEWGSDKIQAIDSRTASDVRLFLAPSYRFKFGSRVSLPLAVGPVFTLLWEESYGPWDSPNYPDAYKDYYYEAMNLGIMADASIVITPFKSLDWLFLKQGICLGWDFLHFERGEMSMTYRQTSNTRYEFTPYSAFAFSIFFGIGVQFD